MNPGDHDRGDRQRHADRQRHDDDVGFGVAAIIERMIPLIKHLHDRGPMQTATIVAAASRRTLIGRQCNT